LEVTFCSFLRSIFYLMNF